MKLKNIFLLVLVGALLAGGCSQKLTSEISPGVHTTELQSFYVVHFTPDKRNLHQVVESQLNDMGFKASSGEEKYAPDDVDAIVTYIDNWQWDMTNYMVKIKITFRRPTGNLLANATSFRTSLVRKSPPEMIKETLDEIFNPKDSTDK